MAKSDDVSPEKNGSTRREFIQGAAAALAGATLTPAIGVLASDAATPRAISPTAAVVPAAEDATVYYPPIWQGVRGQNDLAKDVVHALRDGEPMPAASDTGEDYDLVVVGSGMSGLSAAYFFRKALPNAKVLVIEACDDFGGHARRNEFNVDGRQVVAAGGTYFIMLPQSYSPEGKSLLSDIGIDTEKYYQARDRSNKRLADNSMTMGVFFSKEKYGEDRLVCPGLDFSGASNAFQPDITWTEFLARTPLSATAQKDILRLVNDKKDHMPGVKQDQKIRRLRRQSYADYLTKIIGIGPEALMFIQDQAGASSGNVGVGPDSFSAWHAYGLHLPGFAGLDLPKLQASGIVRDDQLTPDIHLPDGNGAIARLLVRWLIPSALPGKTMEDSVARRVDYAELDRVGNDVRIRLSSPVISVEHDGEPDTAQSVSVTYMKDGKVQRVKAASCVMACFNSVVPYLCPQLPEPQKEALHMAVRKPLLIATVALRNWRAIAKLKTTWITAPGSFYYATLFDIGIDLGDYRGASNPNNPATVMMMHVPNFPGMSARDQFRTGRSELLSLNEEDYIQGVRDQLGRMLSPGGFDSERDIAGITINRWAHGYAGGGNDLYDPEQAVEDAPWIRARQRFGRITIANSDAAGTAMTQAAFDQANRAVKELLYDVIRPVFSIGGG